MYGARGQKLMRCKSIAKEIDKEAFIIIMNAREVIGKGFKI